MLLAFTTMAEAGKEVNVYSHRHYPVDRMLFEQFTEQTGISVNVVKASADQLIKRLEVEGDQSPADVLITVDAGRLFRAQSKGLLQPVESQRLRAQVPEHLRDPAHYWYGLTIRARAIAYAKDRVKPEQLSTYEALTEPQWEGKVLIRSAQNIYNQSLMASMIVAHGHRKAAIWAEGMVRNFARTPKGNDRDQVKAIANGVGDVAIVNSYYMGKLLNSEDEAERTAAAAVKLFFPNQDDRGTHINISGAGVTASSTNLENAIALLEFLSGRQAQQAFARANFEYPVNPKAEDSPLKIMWGDFKTDNINLSLLGKHNFEAVTIFAKSGWR
jgi:iron(III) transport system substrate-binding protein